ncbi:MAG: outer membrane beta-barrel protein [Treponema sp.]|jgi:opacity protein-like surface antigen|nr:outer membrane beta-barrel protein [Treponema sp.]
MKRAWAIIAIAVTVGTAACGQETAASKTASAFRMSIGAGGALDANFSTWFVDKDVSGDLNRYNSSSLGTAPYVFLDLKYVELTIGLGIGKVGNFHSENLLDSNSNFPARTLSLRGGVYLKLPLSLSSRFSLYPLAGADYELFMAAFKNDDRDAKFPISTSTQDAKPLEALSTVSFKLGVGLDTFLSDHLFLRTELLYGIRVPNKFEQYQDDLYTDVDSKLFHSGDFKIAIGWRF